MRGFGWLGRNRRLRRLDQILPNPRSAHPRGQFVPAKRDDYTSAVLRAIVGRLLIVAALGALAVWLVRVYGGSVL